MKIILAAPPEYSSAALATGLDVAFMAYGSGKNGGLVRVPFKGSTRGGLMHVYISGPTRESFHRELLGELEAGGFDALILDSAGDMSSDLVKKLAPALSETGKKLYLPHGINRSGKGISLLPTALSGGSLIKMLTDAAGALGPERVALETELVRMDFTLPCPDGAGTEIDGRRLKALLGSCPACFSEELCTNYLSYREAGDFHFVLFDNGYSIKRKLALAESAGISTAFLYYPRVRNILAEIIR